MKKKTMWLAAVIAVIVVLTTFAAAGDVEGARSAILNAMYAFKDSVDISSYRLTESEFDGLYDDLFDNEPDIFFVNGSISYSYNASGITSIYLEYYDTANPAAIAAYKTAVSRAKSAVNNDMSDVQKALALHDWLANVAEYDYETANGTAGFDEMGYTAYGALVKGLAVCEGYSKAYLAILRECGIKSLYIGSDVMNHGWNIVQLDGEWYHVDVTWDDGDMPGRIDHVYFLVSDDVMGSVRAPGSYDYHYGWQSPYECTSDKYDSAFWKGVSSRIVLRNGASAYYLASSGGYKSQTINLVRRDWNTGEETVCASVRDYWPVWNADQYWAGVYSGLAYYDGVMYFNDKTHIYGYVPGGQLQTVMTYDGGEGYIYGIAECGEGIKYVLSYSPNETGVERVLPISRRTATFADVASDEYYFDAVEWAASSGVTVGIGNNAAGQPMFGPGSTCTRGQVVTFLWRSVGSPEPANRQSAFEDVREGDYYYKAVAWAVENNITNGMEVLPDGRQFFRPDTKCSYAHILTFLYRTYGGGSAGVEGTWYDPAYRWAGEKGLLFDLYPVVTDRPNSDCPRCDVVVFLYRNK